jgi:imidazole glycerol-phosphate synthase subunit HisH
MIALINYGAGNTASVMNVLKDINAPFILTKEKADIRNASRIILPGVGEAASAMNQLRSLGILQELITATVPFLGICLGMQLLCKDTEEGSAECFGLINSSVRKFDPAVKVPHMGWNNIDHDESNLHKGIVKSEYFYFAHSYYVPVNEFTTSTCSYGVNFSASLKYKNFYGVQFHPEKSAKSGISLIRNFMEL